MKTAWIEIKFLHEMKYSIFMKTKHRMFTYTCTHTHTNRGREMMVRDIKNRISLALFKTRTHQAPRCMRQLLRGPSLWCPLHAPQGWHSSQPVCHWKTDSVCEWLQQQWCNDDLTVIFLPVLESPILVAMEIPWYLQQWYSIHYNQTAMKNDLTYMHRYIIIPSLGSF